MENVKLLFEIDITNLSEEEIFEKKLDYINKVLGKSINGNVKLNFIEKYERAVGLDNRNLLEDYSQPSENILNKTNFWLDDSKNVFEIIYPKNHLEMSMLDGNYNYKGKEFLRGFKKFLCKVFPEAIIQIISTDDTVWENTESMIINHIVGYPLEDFGLIAVEILYGNEFTISELKDSLYTSKLLLNKLYAVNLGNLDIELLWDMDIDSEEDIEFTNILVKPIVY